MIDSPLYTGIDFGTSGARAIVMDEQGLVQSRSRVDFPTQPSQSLPQIWQAGLDKLLLDLPEEHRKQIVAIAINGTSSTVLLCDRHGVPLTEPLLYSDNRGEVYLDQLRRFVPENHTVLNATSSLAKLWWWQQHDRLEGASAPYFLHQADWLGWQLHGELGISDYHNSLKLGYDVQNLRYPDWLLNADVAAILPRVVAPGTPVAPILSMASDRYGIPTTCWICAGTTDSIAAFLASGAQSPGEAVTSLGSTLVLKLLSTKPVEDLESGVYSHRFGNLWLVGGASNTGGAVLKQFFTDSELVELSTQMSTDHPSPYQYYPLLKPGERFPINDPHLQPQLVPRPTESIAFLQGLLESMARIEAQGYQQLQSLGATPLKAIYTAGGGAQNPAWTKLRQRYLAVPFLKPLETEAAYGAARLAQQGLQLALVKSRGE